MHVDYVIDAHKNHSKKPENAVRRWDGTTPYFMHPLWCATTMITETSLPEQIRETGSLALLYHDVLEDTTAGLLDELPEDVRRLILEMTSEAWAVPEGSAIEMQEIWSRSPEARLLKLYDKTSNLLDGVWMPPGKHKAYVDYTRKLADDVRSRYGELNITRIAGAITSV